MQRMHHPHKQRLWMRRTRAPALPAPARGATVRRVRRVSAVLRRAALCRRNKKFYAEKLERDAARKAFMPQDLP